MYAGIVKRKTFAWPSWSAFRDQSGEKAALISAAPVEIAPANVYELVSCSTIKVTDKKVMEIGKRAINPGIENARPPGVAKSLR